MLPSPWAASKQSNRPGMAYNAHMDALNSSRPVDISIAACCTVFGCPPPNRVSRHTQMVYMPSKLPHPSLPTQAAHQLAGGSHQASTQPTSQAHTAMLMLGGLSTQQNPDPAATHQGAHTAAGAGSICTCHTESLLPIEFEAELVFSSHSLEDLQHPSSQCSVAGALQQVHTTQPSGQGPGAEDEGQQGAGVVVEQEGLQHNEVAHPSGGEAGVEQLVAGVGQVVISGSLLSRQ